jgi:hypothetical protein
MPIADQRDIVMIRLQETTGRPARSERNRLPMSEAANCWLSRAHAVLSKRTTSRRAETGTSSLPLQDSLTFVEATIATKPR